MRLGCAAILRGLLNRGRILQSHSPFHTLAHRRRQDEVFQTLMAEKRMHCWNCPRYSRVERRCADGKANPKKKADSVTVAEVLGVRALCHYNPYRDALAARMYFPRTPLGIESVPPRRTRRGKDRQGDGEMGKQGE